MIDRGVELVYSEGALERKRGAKRGVKRSNGKLEPANDMRLGTTNSG